MIVYDQQLVTMRGNIPYSYKLEYLSGKQHDGSVLPEDVQITFFSADLSRYPRTFRSIRDPVLQRSTFADSLHYWFYDFAVGIGKEPGSESCRIGSSNDESEESTHALEEYLIFA